MQDNHKVSSAEAEFLDQSWDKMSLLLDEHMPHAAPPKPSRPKYELLLLLGLFAWTVYLYWPEKNVEKSSLKKTEQEDIIAQNEKHESLQTESATLQSEQIAITSEQTKSNSFSKPQTLSESRDFKAEKSTPSKLLTADLPKQSKHELINISRKNNPVAAQMGADKLDNQFAELNYIAGIDPLPHAANLFPLTNYERGHPALRVNEVKRKRSLIMGIHAGKLVDRNQFSGYSVGVFAELELNRRFSLFSGLELNGIKKINPVENSFSAAEDFFELKPSSSIDAQALGSGMSILYGTAVNNDEFKVLGVSQMNYVNMPLELVFKVNPSMRVNIGMSMSYLMSASMQNDQRPGGWSSAELTNDNPLSGKYGQELLGVAINRWDFAPSIGFSFRPARRLTLDLKFRNGIIDISKDDFFGAQEYHSNRYLHLGLGVDLFEKKIGFK